MTEDIKPEVIKRTQDSLKKFVTKPPLTEKLLRKPPFRFLHDLITSIMKDTGYLEGLYTPEELNPDNIKDRDGKIQFLEKLIAVVKISTAANINARPTKIVAGLEVEKTNELLQAIGKALEKKIDSSKAVEQVLNKSGKKIGKSNKETSKSKSSKEIEDSKTKDKSDNAKKKKPSSRPGKEAIVKEAVNKLKQSSKKDKENATTKRKDKSPTKTVTRDKGKILPKEDEGITIESQTSNKKPNSNQPTVLDQLKQSDVDIDNVLPTSTNIKNPVPSEGERAINDDVIDAKSDKVVELAVDKSVIGGTEDGKEVLENVEKVDLSNTVNEEDIQHVNEQREPDVKNFEKEEKGESKPKRPSSAHPGHRRHSSARRISDAENSAEGVTSNQNIPAENTSNPSLNEVQVLGATASNTSEIATKTPPPLAGRVRSAVRPPSARPGAPRVRDRGHVEVVEDVRSPSVPVNVIVDADGNKDDDDENLVVLDTQSLPVDEQVDTPQIDLASEATTDLIGQEHGHLVAQILETQRELELTGPSATKVDIEWEGGRKRERESALKEVERLRGSIQSLTRAANPLGKLIDFLQEDVDSMQREFTNWQQMNARLSKELQSEQSYTESSLEPLRLQLDELDQLIQDELEKVSAAKANIIRNDERILKMLPGVHNS